jgi:hypothetical protein
MLTDVTVNVSSLLSVTISAAEVLLVFAMNTLLAKGSELPCFLYNAVFPQTLPLACIEYDCSSNVIMFKAYIVPLPAFVESNAHGPITAKGNHMPLGTVTPFTPSVLM